MLRSLLILSGLIFPVGAHTQHDWQQQVSYQMEIDFDVQTHRFSGSQLLVYLNNSPDTITRAYYHLYFNAFQKGSAMDIRNQNIPDPDRRISQIKSLQPGEEGFLHVLGLTQDESHVAYVENETILIVDLAKPLLPGASTRLKMTFSGQVPRQIRRSGRDNAEGIAYSMSQWYPKLCAYDVDGWHPDPYISREFYGDFGDFDVRINIARNFIVAATGQLQNQNSVGYGYEDAGVIVDEHRSEKVLWHFRAEHVHDFVWAADPGYTHTRFIRKDSTVLHFFFKETPSNRDAWSKLPAIMDRAFDFVNTRFGQYPYKTYAFIQGGDGGMEYPMATLITGNRPLYSLVGVAVHELMHSWYQSVLATNESLYAWMDEGFANYTAALTMQELRKQNLIPHMPGNVNGFEDDYRSYFRNVRLGIEEPMSTHADHFVTNTAYFHSAYPKGCVFLAQLEYIIGSKAMQNVLLKYFNSWKFRHPGPLDFLRIAEKESGMILDWYYEYWILSTKTIDYGIKDVQVKRDGTRITLHRIGIMPMPIEVMVKTEKGREYSYYIPLDLMRGNKPLDANANWTILQDWQWANPEYTLTIPVKISKLSVIQIDPSERLADIDRSNNTSLVE